MPGLRVSAFFLLSLVASMAVSQDISWDTTALHRSYLFTVAPGVEGEFYCIGDTVVYRSTDEGATWTIVGSVHLSAQRLAVGPTGILYAGDVALGVHRSTDGGTSWSGNLAAEGCNSLATHPDGYVFAGLTYTGNGKVHRSTNAGLSWTGVQLPNATNSFATECFAFGSPGLVYAGTINGFYKSTDFGVSWMQSNTGLSGTHVRVMTVTPDQTIYIYTIFSSTIDGFYKSTDRGESWQRIQGNAPYFTSLTSSGNGVLYGTSSEALWRSEDSGVTWVNVSATLGTNPQLTSVVITPEGRILLCGHYLYRSRTTLTGVPEPGSMATGFSLDQNFPNPFNPTTSFGFRIPAFSFVSLKVYDILGREVATIVDEVLPPGSYARNFNGTGLASGIYTCRLRQGEQVATRRLVLVK